MIPLTKELKEKLEKVKCYLEMLTDPVNIEKIFVDVYAVRNENNEIIPGALCYDTHNSGESVTILGGIHMNETSGIHALLEFHNRWVNGKRPKGGKIFTAIGDFNRITEFIDTVLETETMSPTIWSSFGRTDDSFNFNRIPWDILSKKKFENRHEQHAFNIIKHTIIPSRGKVLDIHNTSTNAPPMVTLFMETGEAPEKSVERMKLTKVTSGLPIRDFILWKPGPYNGMDSIRSFGEIGDNTIPLLIEAGAGFDPKSFDRANDYAQIWLRNVIGMELDESPIQDDSTDIVRAHYVETAALYHPQIRPQDYLHLDPSLLEAAKKDTLILIRDWPGIDKIKGWSTKARQVLDTLKELPLSSDRLDNFKPMKKGEIIAIGLKTGLEIRSRQDGFILMVGTDPFIKPTFNETFANLSIMLR
ncbi:MAG: hypothetical protein QM498_12940 [Desulfobacterium sp.]